MAKIVYACLRDISTAPHVKKRIEAIISKLVPDNIVGAGFKIVDRGKIIYGISTYSGTIAERYNSVCMGMVSNDQGEWWKPKTGHPEGTYGIFRADEEHVEVVTDICCSRAIWYYKDDTVFIAGTSQRAVIKVAGKFELERRNIPWMLSSGSMAPSLSWSKNVHFVEPDGSILLNRKTWEITLKSGKAEFIPDKMSDEQFQKELKETLLDSFRKFDIDLSRWILPISGGYDSRGIACLFKETGKDLRKLDSITWGNSKSRLNKHSDGYLGAAIAKSLDMPHRFLATDRPEEPFEKVFERFIRCGEGRVDHIAGYADGMSIWKNIFESGKDGILRGDEPFGVFLSGSILRSRLVAGLKMCEDYSNLENYEQYGFEKQVLPEHLKEVPGVDTPALYRDKLYQLYRMPVTMSALSDIKCSYTEVLNPFFTREIVLHTRRLPDHLRTEKLLFTRIINEISPKIPYASEEATNDDILKTAEATKIFTREINADYMSLLFPKPFLAEILTALQKASDPSQEGMLGKLKKVVKRNLPPFIKDNLRKNVMKPRVDISKLAFRVYVTGKAYKMFSEDIADNIRTDAQNDLDKKVQNTF